MPELIVKTTAGEVRGLAKRDLHCWFSIPFASASRLRAPSPAKPWDGVRDCTSYGPQAPQRPIAPKRLTPPMSEDCLSINVTAPALPSPELRPVMVYIHGGGYTIGTSRQGLNRGDSLVRRGDLLVVSFNYRLGALGYFDFTRWSTPEQPIESNLGLRDQVAALEWVRDNIEAFGGDPSRVTIFGESAGGNAVTTLMTTPAARGLFHAAIAQSPAPSNTLPLADAQSAAARIVDAIGGPARLFSASAAELVVAADDMLNAAVDTEPGTRAACPVIDGDFLPENPLDAFEAGRQHPVPLVVGTNHNEGTLFPRFWDIIATTPQRLEGMFARVDAVTHDRVTAAYPGYPTVATAIEVGADSVFWWPTTLVADAHRELAPTWSYRYDFAPRSLRAARLGATHGTELPVVFGYGLKTLGALGDRRAVMAVSDRVQAHWIHVARHGCPLPSWPAYATQRTTLVIDAVDHLEDDPRRERRLAWTGYPCR